MKKKNLISLILSLVVVFNMVFCMSVASYATLDDGSYGASYLSAEEFETSSADTDENYDEEYEEDYYEEEPVDSLNQNLKDTNSGSINTPGDANATGTVATTDAMQAYLEGDLMTPGDVSGKNTNEKINTKIILIIAAIVIVAVILVVVMMIFKKRKSSVAEETYEEKKPQGAASAVMKFDIPEGNADAIRYDYQFGAPVSFRNAGGVAPAPQQSAAPFGGTPAPQYGANSWNTAPQQSAAPFGGTPAPQYGANSWNTAPQQSAAPFGGTPAPQYGAASWNTAPQQSAAPFGGTPAPQYGANSWNTAPQQSAAPFGGTPAPQYGANSWNAAPQQGTAPFGGTPAPQYGAAPFSEPVVQIDNTRDIIMSIYKGEASADTFNGTVVPLTVTNVYDLQVSPDIDPVFATGSDVYSSDYILVNNKYLYLNFHIFSKSEFKLYPDVVAVAKCFNICNRTGAVASPNNQMIYDFVPAVFKVDGSNYTVAEKGKITVE